MKSSILLSFVLMANISFAQSFKVEKTDDFKGGETPKKILLLKNSQNGQKVIAFKTNLAVNTDGIPSSYHPYHLRGDAPAINTILNAIYVYRTSDNFNLSVPNHNASAPKGGFPKDSARKWQNQAYSAIERWRDSGYEKMPDGYKMPYWSKVLASKNGKPCVLTQGDFKGFFVSLTAVKQEIKGDKGECDCNDQLNAFEIPALVLAANSPKKGPNPVRSFGGGKGDIVITFNEKNNSIVFAIIGDEGPAHNLGEGSVLLNMKLMNDTKFPTNLNETYNKAIGNSIITLVIPNSKKIITERPYTEQNIEQGAWVWLKENGIQDKESLLAFFKQQAAQF
jgi:hypothetical protein